MMSFTAVWTNLQGTLAGLNGTLSAIAYSILVVTFLLGVYEAFLAGASLRAFAIVIIKFAVASGIIANWGAFFTDVTGFGTMIGQSLLVNGQTDMFQAWWTQMQSMFTSSNSWPSLMLSFGMTAIYSILALAIAVVSVMVMAVSHLLLGIFYAFWGGVLYILGPLLVALAPSGLVSEMTGAYAKKLAEWALWPTLYAILIVLMQAANMSSLTAVAQGATDTTFSVGGTIPNPSLETALSASIYCLLYGIIMLALPFVAHFVIGGNFAGAAMGSYAIVKQAAAAVASGGTTLAATTAKTAESGGSGGGGSISGSGGGNDGGGESGRYSGTQSHSTPPPPTPTVVNGFTGRTY
jgi:hypothetical protein